MLGMGLGESMCSFTIETLESHEHPEWSFTGAQKDQ